MASRFITPVFQALDSKGKALPGAQLFFYEVGSSSTLKDTFSDSALTIKNANPVVADGAGVFPNIFGDGEYRVTLNSSVSSKSVQEWARDNVRWDVLTQGDLLSNGGTILQAVNGLSKIDTIADLRNFEPTSDGQSIFLVGHTTQGLGDGEFYFDSSDTTSSDNNFNIIVTVGGARWKRPQTISASPFEAGATLDGVSDDTTAIQTIDDLNIILELSGIISITKSFKLNHNPIVEDGTFTITNGISGVSFSTDGVNISPIWVSTANSEVNGLTNIPQLEDIGLATDTLTSMTNSTSGTDSDGDFIQLDDTGNSRSNDQIFTDIDDLYIRIVHNGRLLPTLSVDWKDSGGVFISTATFNWYGTGAEDQEVPLGTFAETVGFINRDSIPATAARFALLVADSDFSPTTNKGDVKLRSLNFYLDRELRENVGNPSVSVQYKGVSKQNLQGVQGFINDATMSFADMWQDLQGQSVFFKANGFRIQIHLDAGMNKDGSGIYTGTLTTQAITNLTNMFVAADILGLKVMSCVYVPERGDTFDYTMDQDAQTIPAKATGYADAMIDYVELVDKFDSSWGYDPINEPAFQLGVDDLAVTYTYVQGSALSDQIATAAKTVTDKPIVYSMADGYHGPQSIFYLDLNQYDVISSHGYFRVFRPFASRALTSPRARMSGEIGYTSGETDEAVRLTEIKTSYNQGKSRTQCAWVWEAIARRYVNGSVVTVSASVADAYRNFS